MTWRVNALGRTAVLEVLSRAARPITVAEIARRTGRRHTRIQSLLYRLELDGLVRCERARPAFFWRLAGRPPPVEWTPDGNGSVHRHDHRALAAALGEAESVPARLRALPATIHVCR